MDRRSIFVSQSRSGAGHAELFPLLDLMSPIDEDI